MREESHESKAFHISPVDGGSNINRNCLSIFNLSHGYAFTISIFFHVFYTWAFALAFFFHNRACHFG
jgi:hypothetical protein